MKRAVILAVLILFAALPPVERAQSQRGQGVAPKPSLPASGKPRALLIAVQKYQHPSVNPLDYPLSDARRLQQILTAEYNFEPGDVEILQDPDREKILSAFDRLSESLKPDDSLLIFYAGHGYWDETRRQGYWLPSDAQRGNKAKWISNGDLRDAIRGIKARHTLLISDACFSGSLFVSREAFTRTAAIEELSRLPSRTAMTSGALTTVPDRSVFVEYLVKRLRENREAYLPAGDLFTQLRGPVINNSPNRQTPRYGVIQEAGDEGGEFIFVRRVVAPPPETAPVVDPAAIELALWQSADKSNDIAEYEEYLRQYPNGRFAVSAKSRIARLRAAAEPRPVNPTPALPPVKMSAAGVPLVALSPFTTVTVDDNGKIVGRKENQECWGYVEDLGNGVKLEMVEIPAGEFLMGQDAAGVAEYERECSRYVTDKAACQRWANWATPQHRVRVSGFSLGKYEVTQAQWKAVMGGLPPGMTDLDAKFKGDQLPVVRVSWDEVQQFLMKLGKGYRLPSEAEWEYAARAGARTAFSFGPTIGPEVANYDWDYPHGNAPKKTYPGGPMRVGSFPANAWGLFDMHGNVWEWCEDDWHDNYNGAPVDGRAWVDISRASLRVNRGGGWSNNAVYCRSAFRVNYSPGNRSNYLGFRLSRTLR